MNFKIKFIGTHSVQVDVTNETANITFAANTTVRGVYINFTPLILNRATCKNQFREMIEKPSASNTVSKSIQAVLGGALSTFTLVESGIPDPQAVLANQPQLVTVENRGPQNVYEESKDPITNVEHKDTSIVLHYRKVSVSKPFEQYIGMLTQEINPTYTLLYLPLNATTKQIEVQKTVSYCLTLYALYTDKTISSKPIGTLFIEPIKCKCESFLVLHMTTGLHYSLAEHFITAVSVGVTAAGLTIIVVVVIILVVCYCKNSTTKTAAITPTKSTATVTPTKVLPTNLFHLQHSMNNFSEAYKTNTLRKSKETIAFFNTITK